MVKIFIARVIKICLSFSFFSSYVTLSLSRSVLLSAKGIKFYDVLAKEEAEVEEGGEEKNSLQSASELDLFP
jgi:hypothetical protein